MHHLAITIATAAGTVLVHGGIGALVFRLAGLAVHLNVVHLYITTAGVVGKRQGNFARSESAGGIVLHAGGQRPGLDSVSVDSQADGLLARSAARAYHYRVASTTGAAATA